MYKDIWLVANLSFTFVLFKSPKGGKVGIKEHKKDIKNDIEWPQKDQKRPDWNIKSKRRDKKANKRPKST